MLVIGPVSENDDAIVGPGLAVSEFEHFRLDVYRVSVKQRLGKPHLVPAEIGDCRADRSVADRDAHHERKRKTAIDDRLSEFAVFHVFGVKMQWRRVVSQRTEPDVVRLRNGAPDAVPESLTDREFLEIQSWHAFSSVAG